MSINDIPGLGRAFLGPDYYSRNGFPLGGIMFPQYQQQLAAMQQQQQASFAQMGCEQQMMFMPYQPQPPRKHVESRELSPREVARKQINGAVQAVNEAQEKAR